ncbi:tRNA (5-methylaminomethyl-2-thiouridine)(34)-methyltransferase MnmD [Woodsholea maritima]|uniref:tRNA (5-methylaminomethyl-2-thiouridine)(34)-methyltransferase MnmD n=1 Tax=Woodsholea maritima TaxID=240237 RepID=UPI00036DD657|nr:tRNA (5-methylaminomethyl-2-thiouridine)(34)-methyltransferase MnmD [Woodsholea maritima]
MGAPNEPLSGETLYCPAPDLDWSQPGGPRARDYGDIYFSVDNGLEETQQVFLKGCGLPERWHDRDQFTVAELGFGTGLNFLSLWDLWRKTRKPHQRLHFVSLEGRPLTKAQIERAWQDWPQIAPLADSLLPLWPSAHKGPHRIRLDEDNLTLTVFHDEASEALRDMNFKADAWFLDGFAPAKNPAMWNETVLGHMARLSAPGAMVATFTVAGSVRRGLSDVGFNVSKQPGFGRKRERLEAIYEGEARVRPQTPFPVIAPRSGRVTIIGGGIAAASLVHAARTRGRELSVIAEGGWAAGASGAPLGLFTPRLEAGDRPHQRFALSAFYFARRLYQSFPEAFFATGVARMAKDDAGFKRLARLAELMGPGYEALSAQDLSAKTGLACEYPGLWMADSGYFKPRALVQAVAGDVAPIDARAARVERKGDLWQVFDPQGTMLSEAETVILAGGGYLQDLAEPHVEPSRGQAFVYRTSQRDRAPVTWGGYGIGHDGALLLGSTHEKGEDFLSLEEARHSIEADIEAHCPALMALTSGQAPDQAWRAIRAATPDHLPLLGPVVGEGYNEAWRAFAQGQAIHKAQSSHDEGMCQGLIQLGALGSRGFAHAPLMAEAILAYLCDEPDVLSPSSAISIHTARFSWRALKRGA